MISKEITNQYLKANKKLTLLNGKIPKLKDWSTTFPPNELVLSYKGNLGWVLGELDLVIDVDPKNGGVESLEKLKRYLSQKSPDESITPTVTTPSGGYHYYLKLLPIYSNEQFRKQLNRDYPGIDFLTKGAQCVIPGSSTEKGSYTWYDTLLGEFEQPTAPHTIVELILAKNRSKLFEVKPSREDLGDFADLVGGSSSSWPEEKVLAFLDKLDPSMKNNRWVNVGMALHDWDPVKGLALWEDWSKEGTNYKPGETQARWKSFDPDEGVTMGTLYYMVQEADFDAKTDLVKRLTTSISNSDEKQIEFDIIPKIKSQKIDVVSREKIVLALQNRFKELTNVKLAVGSLRTMIAPTEATYGELVSDEETPEWCRDWIYVNSHQGFVNIDNLVLHKAESFNVECGRYVPMGESGTKPGAVKYVSDRGYIEKADSMAYLPTFDELICYIDNMKLLNSFNPKSVPIEAEEYTEDGRIAIKLIKKHIEFICGDEKNSDILLQWLAHQVQFPGKKILWAPVIQSIEGIGKSFFGELMRYCLGDRNVGVVSPTQVISDFNGWATGVVVNILEELRVKGHNRYDAVNALKPLITDRIIQINDKSVSQFNTYNTANYICFTNYRDSLPLTATDRRWWVIFVQIEDISQIEEILGVPSEIYFPRLFDALRRNPAEIRKWLLEYVITDEFLNTQYAPMTDYKKSMIATEEASFEGLNEVFDTINDGGDYWDAECISSSCLFKQVEFEYPELELNATKKNTILKRLGYSAIPSKIKVDGKTHQVWSKRMMDNDEVRERFNAMKKTVKMLEVQADVDSL